MQRGFSLVELSIVLVILGLLTGGILAGQSLIRASELRSVTTDFNRYVTATQTFRDKYFGVPGDITNATKFWGTATACPGAWNAPSTNAATCDGTGDGKFFEYTSTYEAYRYWQHLANAGLIEGTYGGVTGGASNHYTSVIGMNVPRGKMGNSGFSAWSRDSTNIGNLIEYAGDHGNHYHFGGPGANTTTSVAILKPDEAWNIDIKLDDGRPGYGKVMGLNRASCTDSTAANDFDSEYLLSSSSIGCGLMFRNLF